LAILVSLTNSINQMFFRMKTLTLLFSTLLALNLHAQNPVISWQKSLGGSNEEIASSIQQTSDGGYIVAGYSGSTNGEVTGNHGNGDYWIVKLSSTGDTIWQKSLGGSLSDMANSIQQTSDGGYIVAGYSSSTNGDVTGNHGVYDYWIVKLSSSGTIIWQKSIGGSSQDYTSTIQQTSDGGYIIAGSSQSTNGDVTGNHGNFDCWIVKLNSSGTLIWQKSLGGSGDDFAYQIRQTSDGGYIVAGVSSSTNGDVTENHGNEDYWIIKLNSSGVLMWQKSLGGSGTDVAYSIQQTSDGGFIVAGYSGSNDSDVTGNNGSDDYWIVKLSPVGDTIWQKSLGGSGADVATSIQQTSDGGFIVAGVTSSNDGDMSGIHHGGIDYCIIKLNSTGNILWHKLLGGSNEEITYSIQQTSDYGYIVAGYSNSTDGDVTGNHGDRDYWIVKLPLIHTINVLVNPSGAGSITGSGPCGLGLIDTLTATPDSHYTFANWTENVTVVSTNSVYSFTVNGDRSLIANFTPKSYIITTTANPANQGFVSGAGTYTYNQSVTVTATPASSCYSFVKWLIGSNTVSFNSSYSFTATNNVNLTALFTYSEVFNHNICYVEFDTLTYKNKIVWDTPPTGSDSIYIYSEVSTNIFDLIGQVPSTTTNFIDTNSNPQAMSNSYKITVTDSCSNEGIMSDYHKTITLLSAYDQPSNTYGFTWSAYEGLPVANYSLYGIMNSGQVIQIGSVPGNTYFYNYPSPSPLFVKFFIGFETPDCSAKADHLVRSNYLASVIAGIDDSNNNPFIIYPNPAERELFIESSYNQNYLISITNSQGQLLKQDNMSGAKNTIDVSQYEAGIYFVKIQTESGVQTMRFVK